jgi:N4-gp56 family major capsid protein
MTAQFTWTLDAPTGVYKSHAMSERLYYSAIANAVMMDFVMPLDGFGRKRGETMTLTRVSALTEPSDSSLSETDRIPEDTFSIGTTSVTVSEFGRSVPFTSLSEDLSEYNVRNPIQRRLRDQLGLVLDTKAATAFKDTQIKYSIDGLTSASTGTSGSFSSTSAENMNVYHVEEIRDLMRATYSIPPYDGGDYVGVFNTLGLRGIKRDASWEEWKKYTEPQAKFNSEVGRMEEVRFVESWHSNAFGQVGTGSVLGEGVVFGAECVGLAEALTPEIRVQINVGDDFGRSHAAAWYGILEFLNIWGDSANAGEAKSVHVGSA